MNREIKFRAWIERQNKMVDVDVLAIGQCTWGCETGKQGINLAAQPHIPVMQYTGLKDKNGKDIYEGDIIQFAEKYFYVVKYEDAKFVGYHANNDWGKWGDLYKLGEPDFKKYNYVITGNIYQNPELLTTPPLPKE
jgi:uncharacterized phage protein (TIGR01671 family)